MATELELQQFANNLKDRFGKIPNTVAALLDTVRLKWAGKQLGMEKIALGNGGMRCYFPGDANAAVYHSDSFVAIMGFAFVGASAIAKVVNATTNLASIIVVGFRLGIMWKLGLLLGIANLAGGYLGSHLAIKKGSNFVRFFYLFVTALLILRLGYSLFLE